MLASLSTESQINQMLEYARCAPSNFAEIANRHAISRVLQALKGANNFSQEDAPYYLSVAKQIKQLAEDYPVPIAWKETLRIRQLLAERNQGIPTRFWIVLIDETPFRRISAGRLEVTNNYQDCAAFDDIDVAYTVAKVLRDSGHSGIRVTDITNTRRSADSFVNTLAEVGFVQ
jgi:hypothetical protein